MKEKNKRPRGAMKISVSYDEGQLTISGRVRTPRCTRFLRRLRRLALMTIFGGGVVLLGGEHAAASLHLCQIGLSVACGYVALGMR